jgi:hypothetical protein
MVAAIVFYGTFIFKRALTATGKIGGSAFSVTAPQILEQLKEAQRGSRDRSAAA